MNKETMLELLIDTGIYLVTEDSFPGHKRLQAVDQSLAAGARMVQLRDKNSPKGRLLEEAKAMKALCARWGAVFIVNDDLALAWCADADGVHVGQGDFPAMEARRLLGKDKLVGLSASTLEEAREAERLQEVDYIGVGAIFATPTKLDAEVAGLDLLRSVRRSVSKPLVAIGGIDASNAGAAFEAGADSVAVVRGVFAQPDVSAATRRLLDLARDARRKREE